jgi:DNA-binding IclR family transcriptional regulator
MSPTSKTSAATGAPARQAAVQAPRTAFAKGLFVLETLVEAAEPLSLSGLVDRTGLPKTTVHRLVSVLVERGWAKETGRGYGLGYLPLRAAASLERSLDIRHEAMPFLTKLRDELDETVHLATLDQEFRVVYLEKIVPHVQAVGLMRSRVGSTAPAYATAVGKAMLACLSGPELAHFFQQVRFVAYTERTITDPKALEADLDQVRRRGYATCDEEHEPGVSCIAAAIRGRRGEPLAAISVSGPVGRMGRHLGEDSDSPADVREAARALSAMFGGPQPSGR